MAGLLNTTAPPGFNDTSSFVFFRTTEHVVAHLLLFIVLCVPALLLNVFNCVVTLSTSAMSHPIKILLVNITLSNLVFVVGVSMYVLGFVVKVLEGLEGHNASCQLFLAVYTWGSLLRLLALPMFGVVTFIIIKLGIEGVRVKLLVCACVVKWVGTLVWSLVVFTPVYRVQSSDDRARCIVDVPSGTFSPVYLHVGISALGIGMVGLLVSFVLTLKGYLYIRNAHADAMAMLRKALVKYLAFLIALNVVSVFGFLIIGPLRRKRDNIEGVLYHYIPFVVFASLANLNPWVMICFFKQLQKKLKAWTKCECVDLMGLSQTYNLSRAVKVEPVPASGSGQSSAAVSPPYVQTSADLSRVPVATNHSQQGLENSESATAS